MSNSIVVDPQSPSPAPKPEVTSQPPAAVPANPLEYRLPSDLQDIDPTYRGKSVADIIEMQRNATRKIGEQANEIGVWRNMISQMTEAPRSSASAEVPQQPTPTITSEQLLDDPTASIAAIVEASLSKALRPFEERIETSRQLTARQQFAHDYPEASAIGQDPEFQTWAFQGRRSTKAQRAMEGDIDAAADLIEAWRERTELLENLNAPAAPKNADAGPQNHPFAGKPAGVEGARQAATEKGGSGVAPQPFMTGQELINLINTNPSKYHSQAFQQELAQAAQDGRITL